MIGFVGKIRELNGGENQRINFIGIEKYSEK